MKRVLSIIISIIIMLCTVSISTEAKEITLSSNKYETNFNHFIYGDYADDPGFVPDYETYEEDATDRGIWYDYAKEVGRIVYDTETGTTAVYPDAST